MSQRSFAFTENCLAIVLSEPVSFTLSVKNLSIQKRHVYYHGCQGRKRQRKNFIFTRRKIDEENYH